MSSRNQEDHGLARVIDVTDRLTDRTLRLGRRYPDQSRHTPGTLVEFSATGPDPLRQLWGPVSLGPVDGSGLGINVSQLPRTDGSGKLLWNPVVLAVATVPYGMRMLLRGFRQYLSIGAIFVGTPTELIPDPQPYLVEFPVVTPSWSFQDGGIRWHISHMPGSGSASGVIARPAVEDPRGTLPVVGLGTFYDLRAPWKEMNATYNAVFTGRDTVILWAEVLQTDPATRPLLQAPTGTDSACFGSCLPPEDRFVGCSADASSPSVYWRIAGSLIVQYEDDNGDM